MEKKVTYLLLAAALVTTTPATPTRQQGSYFYDDARARPQESPQERARREWQQRWPDMQHCRLPACSTR